MGLHDPDGTTIATSGYSRRVSWAQIKQKLATLGAAATTFLAAGSAQAAEGAGDNRAAILATIFVPAIGWVAFNILEPALNQYKNMRLKYAFENSIYTTIVVAVASEWLLGRATQDTTQTCLFNPLPADLNFSVQERGNWTWP